MYLPVPLPETLSQEYHQVSKKSLWATTIMMDAQKVAPPLKPPSPPRPSPRATMSTQFQPEAIPELTSSESRVDTVPFALVLLTV